MILLYYPYYYGLSMLRHSLLIFWLGAYQKHLAPQEHDSMQVTKATVLLRP